MIGQIAIATITILVFALGFVWGVKKVMGRRSMDDDIEESVEEQVRRY